MKNVRNAKGESALLFASSGASQTPNPGSDPSDFPATILFLIHHGLSVRDANLNGLNSLHCASNLPSIMSLFIDHYSSSEALKSELLEAVAQKTVLGETALHLAALDGNFKVTQLLLNVSADPLVTNKAGKTPKQCTKDPAVLSLLKHAESTISQQYYAKQDALLQELESTPSTSTTKSKPGAASKKNKKVQAKESSAAVQKVVAETTPVAKPQIAATASPTPQSTASPTPKVTSTPATTTSKITSPAPSPVESKSSTETSVAPTASQSASTEEPSWASMVTKTSSKSTSEKVSFKMERTEETDKTAEEVAAASDGLQTTSEETNKKEAMSKAQSMLNGPEARDGQGGKHQTSSSAPQPLSTPPGLANREDEQLQERVNSLHVSAEALELKVEHLLGLDLSDLSMEQLNALADIHRNALACIEEAKLDVVRRQERAFFEEEMERRIDLLKRLHLRDSPSQ